MAKPRNGLYRDIKCGMNSLRNTSQISVINAYKYIITFLNQAPFQKDISFPTSLPDSLEGEERKCPFEMVLDSRNWDVFYMYV